MKRVLNFVKKEAVLSASALLAVISAFFVPPSAGYIDYLDFRVLSLLFCLMLVVAGMRGIGVFHYLAGTLLKKAKSTRLLSLLLVALCFFSSMLITNDVALITFVPFAVMILSMADLKEMMIPVIVLQTIAANLGSMMTPIGNPQNLYLYSSFSVPFGQFILWMLPLTVISLVMLFIAVFTLKNKALDIAPQNSDKPDGKKLAVYLVLFIVCLLCVLRVIEFPVMLVIVAAVVAIVDWKLFKNADYGLLLTFVCFFLFIGNMQHIPAVSELIRKLVTGRELLTGAVLSQVISNVPAAILLSGFTDAVRPLLYGVNIGGLGTLIASLASVISFRCYGAAETGGKGKFMKVFTCWNLIFLAVLLAAGLLLCSLG